jgi:hypothetical protein
MTVVQVDDAAAPAFSGASSNGAGPSRLPQFDVDRIRAYDDARDVAVDYRAIGKIAFRLRIQPCLGADRLDDELLQLDRRHARDATGIFFTALKEAMGDIVAITNAVLVGVAGRHAIAAVVEDAAHKDRWGTFDAHPSSGTMSPNSWQAITAWKNAPSSPENWKDEAGGGSFHALLTRSSYARRLASRLSSVPWRASQSVATWRPAFPIASCSPS